jgi:hypothetical protein
MTTRTFDDLPDSEQDEFLDICAQAKLVPEDFNVSFNSARSRGPMMVATRSLGPFNSRKT